MIAEVQKLCAVLEQHADVESQVTLNEIRSHLSRLTKRQLKALNKRLTTTRDTRHKEVQRIWYSPGANDEMWENYFSMYDPPIHKEHKMLVRAQNALTRDLTSVLEKVKSFGTKKKAPRADAT